MHTFTLQPGKYIAAISGGVDSMVLLDLLTQQMEVEVIVAHVDHGIRPDSKADAVLVENLARDHGFLFETTQLTLGPETSEDKARQQRHRWLKELMNRYEADAILTAHHSDDLIETALINLIRGTGWRGLASLRDTAAYRRPLMNMAKSEIVDYAISRNLRWNEDNTNEDVRFLRNFVRHGTAARLSAEQRNTMLELGAAQRRLREQIEQELNLLHESSVRGGSVSRYWLTMLPDEVAGELLHHVFGSLTRPQKRRLLHFARTARPGTQLSVSGELSFQVTSTQLIVSTPED